MTMSWNSSISITVIFGQIGTVNIRDHINETVSGGKVVIVSGNNWNCTPAANDNSIFQVDAVNAANAANGQFGPYNVPVIFRVDGYSDLNGVVIVTEKDPNKCADIRGLWNNGFGFGSTTSIKMDRTIGIGSYANNNQNYLHPITSLSFNTFSWEAAANITGDYDSTSKVIRWSNGETWTFMSSPLDGSGISGDTLLARGSSLNSPSGNYTLIHNYDGNVLVHSSEKDIWSTNTSGNSTSTLNMQEDGNLVLYNSSGDVIWACCLGRTTGSGTIKNTGGTAPFQLHLQDDGNLVVYDSTNMPMWDSMG